MRKAPAPRWIAGGLVTATAAALTTGLITPTAQAAAAQPTRPAQTRTATTVPAVPATTAGGLGPRAYTVRIVGQYQSGNSWCVPTAGSISLRTLGIKVSQRTLAKKMGTTSRGTKAKTAIPVLNAYARPKKHRYRTGDDISSATKLMNAVSYDVGILRRATVLGVWMEDLPWAKGKGWRDNSGHAIVVYGYNRTKGTITVWDPFRSRAMRGGKYVISAKKLAAASQRGGMYYLNRTL